MRISAGSRLDADLECAPAVHLVKGGLEVIEFEDIRDHAFGLDLARVEISDRPREAVRLGEGADDLDLVAENLIAVSHYRRTI